ncbi:aspartate aminotransferase family protein [Caballeronia cordobensis]|uniref:aspartate aminotransferase family protein n=1 Tax=Caballeronia cordobensis TaxID=1353886 RepID=UPI0005EDBB70
MHPTRSASPATEGSSADTAVFHRVPKSTMRVAVAGDGAYVIDDAGKRYLDASGGAAVSCLGHSHPAPIRAIQQQAARLAFVHTAFFTGAPLEELAHLLIDSAPGDLSHAYFLSGGSESIEAALKLARQYHWERGDLGRDQIISRRQSYHGNTLGALSAGHNPARREPFEAILRPSIHVSPCYAYRGAEAGESAAQYGERLAAELEAQIQRVGADRVMCFIAETVSGATLGAAEPVDGYFRRVREICDQHGILLILDEVMSGMGRTGTLHACEQEGIAPDILVIAKGLGAGYQPIGAMLVSDRVFLTVLGKSGFFRHGHTYTGHLTACAAALAVQKTIREDRLLENVRKRGRQLKQALHERFGAHPHVGDIRGRGLFYGLEFVADRGSKTPFDPACRVAPMLKEVALQHGLMCYPGTGTMDGRRGDHVLIAPPFIIDETHIAELVDKLDTSLAAVFDAAARHAK